MTTDGTPQGDTPAPELWGPQDAPLYPKIPQTSEDFAQLLLDPSTPAEHQAAPPQEKLNPHLFPNRLP